MPAPAKKEGSIMRAREKVVRKKDQAKTQPVHPKLEVAQKPSGELDLEIDGESVCVRASQRVEIKCGQAKIVLRSDGAVFINGIDITTRAKKRQRISGGTVSIN